MGLPMVGSDGGFEKKEHAPDNTHQIMYVWGVLCFSICVYVHSSFNICVCV